MQLDEFRKLPPDQQVEVVRQRRQQVEEITRQYAVEAGLTQDMESILVPQIAVRHELALPEVPDRDSVVRELFRKDTSIKEIQTHDGVVYRR